MPRASSVASRRDDRIFLKIGEGLVTGGGLDRIAKSGKDVVSMQGMRKFPCFDRS